MGTEVGCCIGLDEGFAVGMEDGRLDGGRLGFDVGTLVGIE